MPFNINKIKFGLNIIFDENIYKAIDFASKNNFNAIEVWLSSPQFFSQKYSKKERRNIANYAKSKNVQIQLHVPEDVSLFAHHPKIREATLSYYKSMIDFAKDLDSLTLTLHPGEITNLTLSKGEKMAFHRIYPKYFLKIFRENLGTLCNYAKNKTKLCIENAHNFDEYTIKVVQELLNQNKLFLTWDVVKTYNKNGTIKKDELNFFLKNIKMVKNVHLHDATSVSGHEVIGKGFVDFKFFFNKLKNLDINFIFEIRPHSNVLKSRANLLKILDAKN